MTVAAPELTTRASDAGVLKATRRLMWVLIVPLLALLAVLTVLQYRQALADAERDLLRRAGERAQELEAAARPVMAHVQDLRSWMEAHWHEPPDAGPALRQALQLQARQGAPDGWTLDTANEAQRARWGQVWWAAPDAAPPPPQWLHRAAGFVELARIVHQRQNNLQATWFSAAEANTSFGYPWVASQDILRAMGEPTLQAIAAPRREAVARSKRDLAANPEAPNFWGEPYVSQLDGRAVVSHGASVVVDGVFRGEVSVDVQLAGLQAVAERWRAGPTRSWIVDARQHVLADSAQALVAPQGARADTRLVVRLQDRLPEGLTGSDIDGSLLVPDRVRRGDGWVLVAAVRIGSPFTYVQAVPTDALRAQVLPTLAPNALLALALLVVFVAGQWLLTRHFVTPAMQVLDYLQRLSASETATPPTLARRWHSWLAVVSETFRQQRQAQQRERRSEAFKSAMFDGAPVAVVVANSDGVLVEFNAAAERLFGVAREQALGRRPAEVFVPERRRQAHLAAMDRIRQGQVVEGFDKPVELICQHADGHEFPVELRAFRFELEDGYCYTGFITDLTERKRSAEQIARQRDALRQSEKLTAMGSLLASVAHELNNPLTIVVGRASLIEDKAAGTPMASDATRIREAAERCGRIVRTFLNMARQKPRVDTRVQLNDLVRAAAELLAYTLRSHAVELRLELATGLPEVMADADQIGQVVLNLLVNAQQALAGREGRRLVEVSTGVNTGARQVWLQVSDSGAGVPEALREQIFDPFFTTKGEGSGTGLGLPVSRSIAREHGGDLLLMGDAAVALDAAGKPALGGACFVLTLPLAVSTAGGV